MTTAPDDPIHDVLVIGGGPAGTTIAALLAERGRQVVLFEKDHHPRFHIGESLLPHNMPIFERLGVLDDIAKIAVVKRGADFTIPGCSEEAGISFADAVDSKWPTAFHVERAPFDKILFDNCHAKGTQTYQGAKVLDCNYDDTGVRLLVRHQDGRERQWRGRFLIDASGRDTFISQREGYKRRDRNHNSASLFAHFEGADLRQGDAKGNISVYWFEHGWFWLLPLSDHRMSVGVVCWPDYLKTRKSDKAEFLNQTIALCPPVAARLSAAKRVTEVYGAGNFSYRSTRMFGEHFLILGDAHSFIDPVFSTGVYFAMYAGSRAVDLVELRLDEGAARARPALRKFEREMTAGLKLFSWFIYRFTTPGLQKLFMRANDRFGMKKAVISLLSGHAFGNKPFMTALRGFMVMHYISNAFNWRRSRGNRVRRKAVARKPGLYVVDQLTQAPAVAILIPAFNEVHTIREVACAALAQCDQVIVVDDGSTDGTGDCLKDLPLTVIRHERNLGKAAALARGMAEALQRPIDAVITLDGDGQHRPEDIGAFVEAAKHHPGTIIIGNRLRKAEAVPKARYRANLTANFCLSWACGHWIKDSQCGFRLYPRDVLETVHVNSRPRRDFVFESEFLIVASDLGFHSHAVPIAPLYGNVTKRPSYFRPVRDITMIVLMVGAKLLCGGLRPRGLWRALLSQRNIRDDQA